MSSSFTEIQEKDEVTKNHAAKTKKSEGLNSKRDKVQKQASHLRTKLHSLRKLCTETERTEERQIHFANDGKELERRIKCLVSEKEIMERHIQAFQQRIAELEHRNESLRSQSEADRNAVAVLEKENETLRSHNRSLEGKIQNFKAKWNAAAALLEKERAQNKTLELKQENESLCLRNGAPERQRCNPNNVSAAVENETAETDYIEKEKRPQNEGPEGEPLPAVLSGKEAALDSGELEYKKVGLPLQNGHSQRQLCHVRTNANRSVSSRDTPLGKAAPPPLEVEVEDEVKSQREDALYASIVEEEEAEVEEELQSEDALDSSGAEEVVEAEAETNRDDTFLTAKEEMENVETKSQKEDALDFTEEDLEVEESLLQIEDVLKAIAEKEEAAEGKSQSTMMGEEAKSQSEDVMDESVDESADEEGEEMVKFASEDALDVTTKKEEEKAEATCEHARHADAGEVVEVDVQCAVSEKSWAKQSSPASRVSFSSVEIREYDRILGDNWVDLGPPLSLGWDYEEKAPVSLDKYEMERSPRRPSRDLMLSFSQRRSILLDRFGYSSQDLRREITRARKGHPGDEAAKKSHLQVGKNLNIVLKSVRKKKKRPQSQASYV